MSWKLATTKRSKRLAASAEATKAQADLKREEALLAAGPPSQGSRQPSEVNLLTRVQRLRTVLESAATSRDLADEHIASMTALQQSVLACQPMLAPCLNRPLEP